MIKKFGRGVVQYFKDRPKEIKRAYNDAKLMYGIMYASNKAKMDKMLGVNKDDEK